MVSSRDVLNYLNKIKEFLLELGELFFLPDGIYIQSVSRTLAEKVLIFEHPNRVVREVFLTGPIYISEFVRLIYRLLHLEEYLRRYLDNLNARIRSVINMELVEMTKHVIYIEFFLNMLKRWFNVDVSKKALIKELGVSREHLGSVLELIKGEITNAYLGTSHRSLVSRILPSENRVRVLSKDGLLEYSANAVSISRVYVSLDSERPVAGLSEVLNWLYLLVTANLELEKLRNLKMLKKELESGFLSHDQLLGVLAKEFREKGFISMPVNIGNIETEIRLRSEGGCVYACISTGEYVVKEYLGSQEGAYVYFPSADVCIELKVKQLSDEDFVVYPVEVPVMLDEYAHPSVRGNKGKRNVCLGRDESFINKLIIAAKDIAERKKEKVEIDGFTVLSPEHALAEVLKRVFAIIRYGYKPGATPYRTAASCAGVAGVRIIISNRELEELRRRGLEILE
ncbi:MAG: hypothetical protein QW143_04285 [Candidatus Korarchaeota archaeon]